MSHTIVQSCTLLYTTAQCCTRLCNTVQNYTILYDLVRSCTILYNIVQYFQSEVLRSARNMFFFCCARRRGVRKFPGRRSRSRSRSRSHPVPRPFSLCFDTFCRFCSRSSWFVYIFLIFNTKNISSIWNIFLI